MIPDLPKRNETSHKGDFGRALMIGGSRGMSGAISLAGTACLKSGAGLVRIASAMETMPIVAGHDPCFMTVGLSQTDEGLPSEEALDELKLVLKDTTAVGIGPGLGQSQDLTDLVSWFYCRDHRPMVFDADALNCLAVNAEVLMKPGGPRILTPHPGEMRRLLQDEQSSPKDLYYRTDVLSREAGVVIVLKGHRSLITSGKERVHNTTGNSGMATGGSGDVLTGVITALLCQGLKPFEAAQLGCLVHGLAGDAGAKRLGKLSLTAKDIIRYLPKAFRAVARKERKRKAQVKPTIPGEESI